MNPQAVGRRLTATLSAAVMLLAAAPAGPASAGPASAGRASVADPGKPKIRNADTSTAVPGSYIVVLKNTKTARSAVGATARGLTARTGGTIARTYSAALRGFSAQLSRAEAERLAADPAVAYVEQDQRVSIREEDVVQAAPPSWGLDRLDQRNLPLNETYGYPSTAGNGVHAYIIDTGISFSHREFGGRAVSGFDAVDGGSADDCQGHGTHVSGTVGGATYGVAKKVTLVGVRVLDCNGSGAFSGVLAGIDWVTAHAVKPAVANMSLGADHIESSVDDAVRASIASGVSYAIAAGNSGADACASSPGVVPEALTVAASTPIDASADFTDRGSCVDLYAPGVSITSSWIGSDTATKVLDGTSMASPHVAGVAALYLGVHPEWTAAQVTAAVLDAATPGVLTEVPPNTPNKLLYNGQVQPPADDFSVTTTPSSLNVLPGASVSSAVSTAITRGAAQQVTLKVSGLPTGATATFDKSGIVTGGTAQLTVKTAQNTPAGRYVLAVSAIGTSAARSTALNLTVTNPAGCSGSDATSVFIPDESAPVTSTIAITGCNRAASAASKVTVDIRHRYRGDVVIDLVAPDGSTYRVKDSNIEDNGNDIRATFPVDLASERAEGTWLLRLQDVSAGDDGTLVSWSLAL